MQSTSRAVETNRRGRSLSPGPTDTSMQVDPTVEAAGDWYALWTRSHCERRVRDELRAKGFHTFLPECEVWSIRGGARLRLSVPLFSGYLFLRHAMDKSSYIEIAKTRGLVRILGQRWDHLSAVPAAKIHAIQRVLDAQLHPAPHPFLKHGQRVRIRRGPLAGVEGFLVHVRPERALLVISIELFCRSISIEIDSALAVAA
jgi:transcription termination/antitermination protein NusG